MLSLLKFLSNLNFIKVLTNVALMNILLFNGCKMIWTPFLIVFQTIEEAQNVWNDSWWLFTIQSPTKYEQRNGHTASWVEYLSGTNDVNYICRADLGPTIGGVGNFWSFTLFELLVEIIINSMRKHWRNIHTEQLSLQLPCVYTTYIRPCGVFWYIK